MEGLTAGHWNAAVWKSKYASSIMILAGFLYPGGTFSTEKKRKKTGAPDSGRRWEGCFDCDQERDSKSESRRQGKKRRCPYLWDS